MIHLGSNMLCPWLFSTPRKHFACKLCSFLFFSGFIFLLYLQHDCWLWGMFLFLNAVIVFSKWQKNNNSLFALILTIAKSWLSYSWKLKAALIGDTSQHNRAVCKGVTRVNMVSAKMYSNYTVWRYPIVYINKRYYCLLWTCHW